MAVGYKAPEKVGRETGVVLDAESFDARFAFDILRASPAVTYVYDLAKQTSIFQNRRIGDMLGHPDLHKPGPLGGWAHLVHPEDGKRFAGHRERLQAIKPGEVLDWEYRLRAPDDSWRWYLSRDALLSTDRAGKPHLIVGSATDITEQKDAERQKDILLGEIRHRSRNFAAVVAAIAHQTRPKRPEDGLVAYDAFVARLAALFRAGEVLLTNDDRTADIQNVLTAAVSVVASSTSRIALSGPKIVLGEQATAALALIVHELTTNATKYGALSAPDGHIDIRWQLRTDGVGRVVVLHWQERDGPVVKTPAITGFGTQLMSTAMPNGRVSFEYAAAGLQFGLQFRLPGTDPDGGAE
jgi:two-component sensor histidine kinase